MSFLLGLGQTLSICVGDMLPPADLGLANLELGLVRVLFTAHRNLCVISNVVGQGLIEVRIPLQEGVFDKV